VSAHSLDPGAQQRHRPALGPRSCCGNCWCTHGAGCAQLQPIRMMAGTVSQPGRVHAAASSSPPVKIPAEQVHQQAQVHKAVEMEQSTLGHTHATLATHQPAPCESWPRSLQAPTAQQRKARSPPGVSATAGLRQDRYGECPTASDKKHTARLCRRSSTRRTCRLLLRLVRLRWCNAMP
jgi:hypothetical protein